MALIEKNITLPYVFFMIRNTKYSVFFRLWFAFIICPFFKGVSHSQTDSPPQVQIPLNFTQGWNLFSIPQIPNNFDVDSFFENKKSGAIWKNENENYQVTESIEAGSAYWVYLQDEVTKIIFVDPDPAGIELSKPTEPGWNLIGTYSPVPIPIQKKGTVWHYQEGEYIAVGADLLTGKGYWLNFPGSGSISVGSLGADTDTDEIPDFWEQLWGFQYDSNEDRQLDPDSDNLGNFPEYRSGTNPMMADSDEDGISDGDEFNLYRSNPLKTDTDGDGFSDLEEVMEGGNPLTTDKMPLTTLEISPSNGEQDVAITRETTIRFSRPLAEAISIDEQSISAEFAGSKIPALIHLSPNRQTISLFYNTSLPASARVRVTIAGDQLIDEHGMAVDADNDW